MRLIRWAWLFVMAAGLVLAGCTMKMDTGDNSSAFPAARKAAVEADVGKFVANVARDVTQEGPAAWQKHFADSPAFFMASEGNLVFPDRRAATQAIESLARMIQHIELTWGEDLRVEPLTPDLAQVASSYHELRVDKEGHRVEENGFFTGLAERHNGQWQFRNAHWSVLAPLPKVP